MSLSLYTNSVLSFILFKSAFTNSLSLSIKSFFTITVAWGYPYSELFILFHSSFKSKITLKFSFLVWTVDKAGSGITAYSAFPAKIIGASSLTPST